MAYKMSEKALVTHRRLTDRPETKTAIKRLPDVKAKKAKSSQPLLHRSRTLANYFAWVPNNYNPAQCLTQAEYDTHRKHTERSNSDMRALLITDSCV